MEQILGVCAGQLICSLNSSFNAWKQNCKFVVVVSFNDIRRKSR